MNFNVGRRRFLEVMGGGLAGAMVSVSGCSSKAEQQPQQEKTRKPNIVVVFCDDQGYADVGCFGAKGFKTPNLDRMASEGMRFTDFHAATAVCSASRAGLLTGCYPPRVDISGALFPDDLYGLSSNEVTIAEMLTSQGYATSCVGKWHLGHLPEFLPTRHGFDEYFGLPYSNDMWPNHPQPELAEQFGPLPLIEGEKTIAWIEDQSMLTTWYADRAVDFIKRNRAGTLR